LSGEVFERTGVPEITFGGRRLQNRRSASGSAAHLRNNADAMPMCAIIATGR